MLDAAHRIAASTPFGFLTTGVVVGRLSCRLVQHLEVGEGCEITVATSTGTRKARAMVEDPHVLHAVFDPATSAAATLRSTVSLDTDVQRKESLWRADLAAFFPGGHTSDDIVLVTMHPYEVEVWSVVDGLTPPPYGLSSVSTRLVDGHWSPPAGTHPDGGAVQ